MLLLITTVFPTIGILIILFYCLYNRNNTEHNNLKKYILPLALIFAFYGYSMSFGDKENDLTNYFEAINSLTGMHLKDIFLLDTENLYTRDILFYLVNVTNDVHILPFIVGLIIYSIVFYVLFDMIKRSKRTFKTFEIFMLAIICIGIISPYSIICNVRCVLAYSIITLAIYRDIIQNKKNILTLLLYIVPLGLHTSAILIIIIRVLSALLNKFRKTSIAIALTLPMIIDLIHDKIGTLGFGIIGSMINNAINKAYSYLHWTSGGWASAVENSVSNGLFRFAGAIFLIGIIVSIIYYKYKDKEKKLDTHMISYLYFIAIFALGTLSIKTGAFWRFEAIVVLFSPIIFIKLLEIDPAFKNRFYMFFVFGLLMFLINILYQVRNIDFINTCINYIDFPGLKILAHIFKTLLGI